MSSHSTSNDLSGGGIHATHMSKHRNFFSLSHMGEKEQEVTIQEQGGIHLEIIFITKALVHLYFYAYIKKIK